MIKKTFLVEVIGLDKGPMEKDADEQDIRDSLLDSWGFPYFFTDHPERLVVKLIKTEDCVS
jgi:hypothetical protein